MTDELYFQVILAASSCMVATGLLMAAVKTPTDERTTKFTDVKHGLTIAMLLIGFLNMLQIGFDPHGGSRYLGSCIALVASYMQAMIFTNAVIVLISPTEVTLRRVIQQLGAIAVVNTLLVGAYILLPLQHFFYVYVLCIVLYIAQLIVYTRWYMRCYRQFVFQISAYYEEDEIERSLRWLGILFWVALAVGVLSLLIPIIGSRTVDACLTALFALFYVFLAACFINYQLSSPIILPALTTVPGGETADNPPVGEHPDKLMAWIERKGYLETNLAVEEIAKELDMSLRQFHQHFDKVVGENFRTWRIRKRIEHARQLLADRPDWPVTRIARESGFNDRSNFYQQFKRFTGIKVADYKKGR